MSAALSIREATEADLRFVRASWFESFRSGGHAPQVQFPIYREGQNSIIEGCLARGRTIVAYATEVPDEVCSWTCVEGNLLHYVYTKLAYRRIGIALRLTYANFEPLMFHTHDTKAGRHFAARVGTLFKPYPLYQPRSTR